LQLGLGFVVLSPIVSPNLQGVIWVG